MKVIKQGSKGTSAIISSLMLMLITSFGVMLLTSYSGSESEKAVTTMTVDSILQKSDALEDSLVPYKISNESIVLQGVYFDEIVYIVEKNSDTGELKIYKHGNFPEYIAKDSSGRLIITKTVPSFNIIALLRNGGSLNITEIIKKSASIPEASYPGSDQFFGNAHEESVLDTFVKSLLTPSELYDIYIENNLGFQPITKKIEAMIPINIKISNSVSKREFVSTKSGCPPGKLRPIYLFTQSRSVTLVQHENDTKLNKTVYLSAKAYAGRIYSVKDSYNTGRVFFSGSINDEEGKPVLKYRGWVKITHELVVRSPYRSSCTNYFSAPPPYTRIHVEMEIRLEKIDPNKAILLVMDKDTLDLIHGANVAPSIENKNIKQGSERDRFIIIYSPPGKKEIGAFSEYTVYNRFWSVKLEQKQVIFSLIIQNLN